VHATGPARPRGDRGSSPRQPTVAIGLRGRERLAWIRFARPSLTAFRAGSHHGVVAARVPADHRAARWVAHDDDRRVHEPHAGARRARPAAQDLRAVGQAAQRLRGAAARR
jgi:hypothetical protein